MIVTLMIHYLKVIYLWYKQFEFKVKSSWIWGDERKCWLWPLPDQHVLSFDSNFTLFGALQSSEKCNVGDCWKYGVLFKEEDHNKFEESYAPTFQLQIYHWEQLLSQLAYNGRYYSRLQIIVRNNDDI